MQVCERERKGGGGRRGKAERGRKEMDGSNRNKWNIQKKKEI